jgi:hypothetical protein
VGELAHDERIDVTGLPLPADLHENFEQRQLDLPKRRQHNPEALLVPYRGGTSRSKLLRYLATVMAKRRGNFILGRLH